MLIGTPDTLVGSTNFTIGVDEAGRGPLAGPVVAAAVVLGNSPPSGLADSKVLSAKKRGVLEAQIHESCAWAVGVIEPAQIDEINILAATMEAMCQAVARLCEGLGADPQETLIDGNMTPHGRAKDWRWPARAIVGGDGTQPCISAASIIAKEYRDRIMIKAAKDHPEYGWESNKGYGSRQHMEALRIHGPTPLHRYSFAPVAQAAFL